MQQKKLLNATRTLLSVLLDGTCALIEEKGVAAGNITKELLESTIRDLIHNVGLTARNEVEVCAANESKNKLYIWGGGAHILPEDFDFPSVDTFSAFQFWWLGNKTRGFPPFRLISPSDLSTRCKKQTLSKWKLLMEHVHACIEISTQQQIETNSTEEELARLFSKADLQIDSLTPASRKR